jgi:CheY-specific phosphatase CheX
MTAPHPQVSDSAFNAIGSVAVGEEWLLGADVVNIVETIWSTLFELPLESGGDGDCGAGSTVSACVQIDGAWAGAVILQCPWALATTLTAAIFQADSAPSTDDVVDAIGELANMLAGNVKALLPEPCHISLPAVALGSDQHFSVNGTSVAATASFTCDGHPLHLRVLRGACPTSGAS